EKFFQTAVEADGSSRAHLALAEYYIQGNRLQEASAALQKLTDDSDVGTIARVRLATIDYAAGRIDAATTAIDQILKQKPQETDALLVKASMLFDQKRFDDALTRTNEAIKA